MTCRNTRIDRDQNPPQDKRTVQVERREGRMHVQLEGESGRAFSSRSGFSGCSVFEVASSCDTRSRCYLGKYFSITFINTIFTEYFWFSVGSILNLHKGHDEEC